MPMSLPMMNQTRESSRHPSLDRLNRLIELKNDTEPLKKFETPLYSYDDSSENRFWGIADRDVPILIGAAAGAVGLVFLILGAVLIWYCCQFAFKSDKDMYSLDYESDRASDSSEGTLQPFSDAVLFTGRKATRMDSTGDYIKRSQSAPLNVNKLGLVGKRNAHGGTLPGCRALGGRKVTSGQTSAVSPSSIFTSSPMNNGSGGVGSAFDRRMILGHSTFTHSDVPSDYGSGTDLTTGNSSIAGSLRGGHNSNRYKSYLFTPSNTISQTVDNKIFQLHSGSSLNRYLNHSSPCRSIDEEEEAEMAIASPGDVGSDIIHDGSVISVTITDTQSRDVLTEVISPHSTGVKVNFSKKRRNRMLDDSAAAIAINRTSIGNNLSSNVCSFNTSTNLNDTDTLCLVENESVVVYKERTDL